MDNGVCKSECEDLPLTSTENSDYVCIDEAKRKVFETLTAAKGGVEEASLGPITPDSNREIGDFLYSCNSPPTTVKKPPKTPHFDSGATINQDSLADDNPHKTSNFDSDATINQDSLAFVNNNSPKTPKDGVFDPFAPGPEDMVRAPLCRKYIDEMRTNVARHLNFDCSIRNVDFGIDGAAAESISDEEMFESVYENLLEAIVSNQAEGFLTKISHSESDSDGCKTPPSALLVNGAAESCPGAPMKPSGKSRNIDLGLCRKLEF